MQDKMYACLAHNRTCPSCKSAGQEIEWPEGKINKAFMFDGMHSLQEYAISGLCQKCQDEVFTE